MASDKEYLDYVLDCLRGLDGITYKKMMGEYLLYVEGVLFGGVYDNRFLVKKTPSILDMGFVEAIPYPGAKAMLLVDIEDAEAIKELVLRIHQDLTRK